MIKINVADYGVTVQFPDGTDADTIRSTMAKNFPAKEVKPEFTQGYVNNAIGGSLPQGFEYNESGQAVPKKQITTPGMTEPTKPATGIVDWLSRVVPESTYRTAVGVAKFPYDLAKQITDPLATGFQRALQGEQETPENVAQVGKELAGNAYNTLQGLAEFAGKPIGLYGWNALKEAWTADPAASALGIAPLVKGIYGRAKAKGIKPEQAAVEMAQELPNKSVVDIISPVEPTKPSVVYNIPEYGPMVKGSQQAKAKTTSSPITQIPTEKAEYQSLIQPDPIVKPTIEPRIIPQEGAGTKLEYLLGDEVVGTGQLLGKDISSIHVKEPFRRQGIGTEIINDLIGRGGESGYIGTEAGKNLMIKAGMQDIGGGRYGLSPEQRLNKALSKEPIKLEEKINGITREEAGKLAAQGEDISTHVIDGLKSGKDPYQLQDAINNQLMAETLANRKNPEVRQRLAETQRQVNSIIEGYKGSVPYKDINIESGGLQTIYERYFGNNKPERYTRPGTPESLVDDMYEKTQDAMMKRDGYTWDKIRNSFVRGVLDVSGNVKDALSKVGGQEAKKAIMKKDLLAGADSKSNLILSDAEKAIFSDLSPADYELLNRYRTSKRIMEIGGYKPGVKGPEGIHPGVHASWLNSLPPEKRALLDRKQQEISAVYQDQLTQLKDAGLLNDEGYQALSQYTDYNPRKFMQYLDPIHTFDFGGKKISVPDSGVKPLKEGSEGLLFNDSRTLLAQTVVRTQARIFRNEANKALHDLAVANPNNGIVSVSPPNVKAPAGYDKIGVMIDGQKQELLMPNSMAEEWVKSDPVINRQAANLMGWALMSKPLKMMATGWNPAFALTNIPRDLQLIWTATKEYSPHLPVAMGQMGADIATVFPDVIKNTGRVRDYINQGGGLEFLTTQGRIGGPFSKVSDVMGWIGTKSEMLTRMALRERAIKNGATPEEATHIARNYLDFSQGGNLVKMADVGFPYLNAAVQATRSFLKAAKADRKTFLYKLAQLGTVATSIAGINYMVNKEAMSQISDRDREFNWVFTLPEDFNYIDEDGNKRYYYIKVAKDQAIRPVATMFEALMDKYYTRKIPSDQVLMAWQDFLNIVPVNKLPPVFAASLGYLGNKDFWTWEDIWRGPEITPSEEYTDQTHPAFKTIGEATGLSPERSRYALQSLFTNGNPFVGMVGGGWKLATGDLPKEMREKAAGELLTENKTVKRILSSTNPMTKEYDSIKETRIEDTTRRYKENREIDTLTKEILKNPDNQEAKTKIAETITTVPDFDKERLVDRVISQTMIKDIPNKKWWLSLNHLSAEAKADVWFKKFESSPDEVKQELWKTAIKMPGFMSERVLDRIIQLKTGKVIPQGGK